MTGSGLWFPPGVEDVVRRGLAADRDERFADVPAYVEALREALGDDAVGTLPERWLPLDPELTQPGNRPSLEHPSGDLPEPVPPRPSRRWPAVVLALVLLVAGGVGGFAWWHGRHETRTFTDDKNVLRVTVPASWGKDVSLSGWNPPGSTDGEPAISAGDGRDWRADGQGVFVGLFPGTKLPRTLPQHPDCGRAESPVVGTFQSDPQVTVTTRGCGGFVVESVVQLNPNLLLWVQVRSHDRAQARNVLQSVRTQGSLG
jgi:hypothetical protein